MNKSQLIENLNIYLWRLTAFPVKIKTQDTVKHDNIIFVF